VVLGGIGVPVATSLAFALGPVLAVRRVPPLAVLRRSLEGAPGRDPAAGLAALLGAVLVGGVFVLRAGEPRLGLVSAAVAALALLALGLVARLGALLARAVARLPGPYTLRQGLANLHRPQSPTLAVVVTLGFGAFLLATLVVVQGNLLVQLRVPGGVRANLALFDVQPDQLAPVQSLLREAGARAAPAVPIVPMRLSSVRGEPVEAAFEAGGEPEPRDAPGRAGWVRRREYRSTFRDEATDGERLVAGAPWPAGSWRDRLVSEEAPAPVSVEVELARELGVTVGDSLVWDVQGVPVPTKVASLREVSWARFEPNFFVVFPEGPLAAAPHSSVVLAQLDAPAARARLQRRVLEAHPNVGVLDLAQVQETLDALLDRAASAVRFLALFSLAAGAAVLVGAVAATQTARRREGALLRALGATRGQALQVFAMEYAALGLLAGLAGAGLACGAGALAVRFVVEGQGLALPFGQLLGVAGGVAGLALATGLLASAGALGRPPLEALREE
jgi:putative ABC transport system permease protein